MMIWHAESLWQQVSERRGHGSNARGSWKQEPIAEPSRNRRGDDARSKRQRSDDHRATPAPARNGATEANGSPKRRRA